MQPLFVNTTGIETLSILFAGYYSGLSSLAKMNFSYIKNGVFATKQIPPTTATVGFIDFSLYQLDFDILLSAWIETSPSIGKQQSSPMKISIGTGQISNFQPIVHLGLFNTPILQSGVQNIQFTANVEAEVFGAYCMSGTSSTALKQYFNLNINAACSIKRVSGVINFTNTGLGVILKTYTQPGGGAEFICSRSIFDVTVTGAFGFNLTTNKVGLIVSAKGLADNFAGYIRSDNQNLWIEIENPPAATSFTSTACEILTIPY